MERMGPADGPPFVRKFKSNTDDVSEANFSQEHGLIENADGSVALKCDKVQEAVSYPDKEPHFEAVRQVGHICHSVPLHIIWGTKCDFM